MPGCKHRYEWAVVGGTYLMCHYCNDILEGDEIERIVNRYPVLRTIARAVLKGDFSFAEIAADAMRKAGDL